MDALPIADVTATATLILAGITLSLAIATVALVVVTRQGTARARSDAQAQLKVLERQVGSGYRPLLVDVLRTAPVPPDMGAVYDLGRSEGRNGVADHPGPVIEKRFPGREPALFDPRTAFVSFEAAKIYLSIPLRNVGRGLAVIDDGGIELSGPLVGALEYRQIQRSHVPVAETTRVDLITGYLSQQASDLGGQGQTLRGLTWELTVPYCDFAGEQRTVARLQIACRGDDVAGPWIVKRVQQESPDEPEPRRVALPEADSAAQPDAAPQRSGVRGEPVTDLWGKPKGARRRSR